MELFKWLIDIEEKYKALIEEAITESEQQISLLKSEKNVEMENLIKNKKDFVDSVLNNLMTDLKVQVSEFKETCNNEIETLKTNYLENRGNLVKVILKKLGYDF
ncbi:MAG: hypothetical protein ACFFKA_08345 [Candidatus Thorarchaeota archaeon]